MMMYISLKKSDSRMGKQTDKKHWTQTKEYRMKEHTPNREATIHSAFCMHVLNLVCYCVVQN